MKTEIRFCLMGLALVTMGCAPAEVPVKTFSVTSSEGLAAASTATFDKSVSSDGNGALKISATQPMVVPLYETGNIDVEDNRLMYRAKLRTEGLQGQAYLEMWCELGAGEYFSRALDMPLSGDQDWTTVATPFFLQAGQNPDNVRLNVVIDGQGTLWIDEIEVTKLDK